MSTELEVDDLHEAQRAEVVTKLQSIKLEESAPEAQEVIDYIIDLAERFDPIDERFPYKPEIWASIWKFIANFSPSDLTEEILTSFNTAQLNTCSKDEALRSITQVVFISKIYGLVLSQIQEVKTIENVTDKIEAIISTGFDCLEEREKVLLCTFLSSLKEDGVTLFQAKNPKVKKGLQVLSVITQVEILAITKQVLSPRTELQWRQIEAAGYLLDRLFLDFFHYAADYKPGSGLNT